MLVVCMLAFNSYFWPFGTTVKEYYLVRSIVKCEKLEHERNASSAIVYIKPPQEVQVICGPKLEDCDVAQ